MNNKLIMLQPAPILLFTYKRLDTLKRTVEALKKNELAADSELYIFSDAAKNDADKDIINAIRTYLMTIDGFKKISIFEASVNKGLATSIIDGVTLVLKNFERVIVLEDDLSTTPNFLTFMNSCLEKYASSSAVFSISGYSFNLGRSTRRLEDAYLINRGWSWGWATWRDRWEKVDWNVKEYTAFSSDPKARKAFAKGGSDLNVMLDRQMSGKLDSWAIRWFFHQFKIKGLTVYPITSKVYNDGFDGDATHTTGSQRRYLPELDKSQKMTFLLPEVVALDKDFQRRFNRKMGVSARIISKIETLFQRIVK